MDINELRDKILAVLNQATEGARTVAGQAGENVRTFTEKAADTAKSGGRMAKLAMEVASEKEALKKTYQEIGRLYYETAKDAPDGFFVQLFEEARLAEQSVAAKEAELNELKAGFQKYVPQVTVEFETVVSQDEAEAEAPAEEAPAEEEKPAEEAPAEEAPAEEKPEE